MSISHIGRIGIVILLVAMCMATIASLLAPLTIAQDENQNVQNIPLAISTDTSFVYVGIPTSVTFRVSAVENMNVISISGAEIGLDEEGASLGTPVMTNNNGYATVTINATSPGNITATATCDIQCLPNASYLNASTTIRADYVPSASLTVDKNTYNISEQVNLSLTNNGSTPIQPERFVIKSGSGNNSGQVYVLRDLSYIGTLGPGSSANISWDQKDQLGNQTPGGLYNAEAKYSYNGTEYSANVDFQINSCPNIIENTSNYSSMVGQDVTFRTGNLTNTSRTWNVTWYINGTEVSNETNITQTSSYANSSAVEGVWNVIAVANDGCTTITWQWIWTVNPISCAHIVENPIPYSSNAGQAVKFNSGNLSGSNLPWNVTWYINGTEVYNQTNVTGVSTYVNSSGSLGSWNVTAVADHDCTTINWTFIWTVVPASTSSSSSTNSNGGSSGGGGGSGGGGTVSSEAFSNVAGYESQERDLVSNQPVTYSFNSPELAIYQVDVIGKENEIQIDLRIEHLNSTSALVNRVPPGVIYANENVWIGSHRINSLLIKFRVKNSWIADNNLDAGNIKLLGFDSVWKMYNTNMSGKDNDYTYFEARTPPLSQFAISWLKQQAQNTTLEQPTDTTIANVSPVQTDTNTSQTPPQSAPGFEIISGIGMVSTLYILIRRRRTRRR